MNYKKTTLLDAKCISKLIKRISHEIIESSSNHDNIAVIGIKNRGDYIAKRITRQINDISNVNVSLGTIDVTFHRDDYRTNLGSPEVGVSEINFDVSNRNIILIDDVLYTGRTIRAAMEEIFAYGRPKTIRLAVIVDRGHRELPIKADFVGKNLPTSDNEHIHVQIEEVDGIDLIYMDSEE